MYVCLEREFTEANENPVGCPSHKLLFMLIKENCDCAQFYLSLVHVFWRKNTGIVGSGPWVKSLLSLDISYFRFISCRSLPRYLISVCHIDLGDFWLTPICGNTSTQMGSKVSFYWYNFILVDRIT